MNTRHSLRNTLFSILILSLAAAFVPARAADLIMSDSIVSLATNGTKYYTFVDPASGHFVELAVTMSPYSSDPGDILTSLDGGIRVGVGNPSINGDGNGIEPSEGVNFGVSVVTVSGGVVQNSIGFRIVSLGLRDTGGGAPYWSSSTVSSNNITLSTESLYSLDSVTASFFGGSYYGHLRTLNGSGTYQLSDAAGVNGLGITFNVVFQTNSVADPRTNSWFTGNSSRYARIYTNDVAKTNGITGTTWGNGSQNQLTPAYSGIQEVYSSSNFVYFRTTGLGQHIMGPWYNDATRTTLFINLPKNNKVLYRIPRIPSIPLTKPGIGGGTVGYSVDGLSIFDARDALAWNGTTETMMQNVGGLWWRDAWVNEGITFDPGFAHQPQDGTYHYHANPIATRYLLGDHITFNPVSKAYSESTDAVTKHSPILAWMADGFPLYGPDGYSSPSNAASGFRRMVSGYVIRDGQNGTDNLTTGGRTTLPAWALRAYNTNSGIAGPAVSTTYPLGRYTEDYAFLADLTNANTAARYQQGVDFDLDEYNGRYCVTPEFPNGTYAYFTAIKADGSVTYPYIIGRVYNGALNGGGTVTNIAQTVATNFLGGPNLRETMNPPARSGNNIVLTWSGIEGGTYRVEAENNLSGSNWVAFGTNLLSGSANGLATETNGATANARYYRVARTALANYDPVSGTSTNTGGGGGTFAVPGGSVSRGTGTNIVLNITLTGTPPNPPAGAPVASVTMGSLTASSNNYATAGTVLSTIFIPGTNSLGAQTVVVTFQVPPMGSNAPVYTYNNGFTVNP